MKGVSFIIDCTQCPIRKPIDPEIAPTFQSGKSHDYTLKYEVACHISTHRIMWVSGGVSGAEADTTILSGAGLFKVLPRNERGIADKGYINKDWSSIILTPLPALKDERGFSYFFMHEIIYNEYLSSLRIQIERLFGRMKNCFKVLAGSNDTNLARHRLSFIVASNTYNIMNLWEPLRAHQHKNVADPPNIPLPDRVKRKIPDQEE